MALTYEQALAAYRSATTAASRRKAKAVLDAIPRPAGIVPTAPPVTDTTGTPIPGSGSTGAGGSGTGVNAGLTTEQTNAFELVKGQLAQYGLDSLSTFVYNEIVAGRSSDEVVRDLRGTPEFQKRFPAIGEREKKGLPAISPGEYVSYEKQATQLMRAAGLPAGFYDSPDDFHALLAADVSPSELNSRIDLARQASYNIPADVSNRLYSQFGISPGSGSLTAFFLDPDRAAPLLQRNYDAAKIGAAADRAGYGLSDPQAAQLALQGVTDAQAAQGFTALQHDQSLFQGLPGQGERTISQTEQLGALFGGDDAAQDQIDQRRRQRQAQFQDGGGYAATQKGVAGLGRADS
jgi:hypothetical protein